MEIKKNITIELSASDVKQIIVDYLNKDGYDITESNVDLRVGQNLVGYPTNEHYEPYFKGAFVKCKEK